MFIFLSMKRGLVLLLILLVRVGFTQTSLNDSLWKVYRDQRQPDTLRLMALHDLVRDCIQSHPDSSIALAQKELAYAKQCKELKYQAKAINAMGVASTNKRDTANAIIYYREGLKIRYQINDVEGRQQSRRNILNYFNMQGNPFKALQFLLSEIDKMNQMSSSENKYIVEIADCLIQLGQLYSDQEEQEQALANFLKAEALIAQIKDTALQINTSHTLARLYGDMHNVKKSKACFLTALNYYQANKEFDNIRAIYNQLGLMYNDNDYPYNALLCFKKSLALSDSLLEQSPKGSGTWRMHQTWIRGTTGNLAMWYLKKGELNNAFKYCDLSLKAAQTTEDSLQMTWAYLRLADIYEKQNEFNKAKYYLKLSLSSLKKASYHQGIRDAEYKLARIDSALGHYQEAYLHLCQYLYLEDKVKSEEVMKAATREKQQKAFEEEKVLAKNEQDKKDLLVAEEKKIQLMITSSIAIGLILVVLFAAYVLYNLRLTKRQKEIIELQKDEVEKAKEEIEEKNKDITDSINYAKRIQNALLANESLFEENVPDHFILFKPKDIVAGDFYWAAKTEAGFLYLTADCTGHGVPGAFMSLLNISKLNETVNQKKITRPDLIFNEVRDEIVAALNPPGSQQESKDGMDAILCNINLASMKLTYAAANNSFYIVRNNTLLTCKADKMPVGKGHDTTPFTLSEIELQSGDMVFTFTDGYADQFGGEKGKKFKYKQMEELMVRISTLPMAEQKAELQQKFEAWMGDLEQVDDVCVIGVRV